MDFTLRHGCKINLSLRVLDRLPNGYHSLESLFAPLSDPADVLEISLTASPGCLTSFSDVHTGQNLAHISLENNTLVKAYDWYAAQTGFAPGLAINVRKGIPDGAGLGGGSANAACLLDFLQTLAASKGVTPMEREQLLHGSATIGADVPFFLIGQAAWATGIGERLQTVRNPASGLYIVLVCPDTKVPTSWAFQALDAYRETTGASEREDSANKIKKMHSLHLTSEAGQATYSLACWEADGNDFEEVVFPRFPELIRDRQSLVDYGAGIARMSGTGASIFGLFQNRADAQKAVKILASKRLKVYMQQMI